MASGRRCGGMRGEGVGHGTSLPGTAWTWHCDIRGAHGNNFGTQCVPAVRKKPRFTHVRGNLRGDVSGKRFSSHVMERNVDRIGEVPVWRRQRDGKCRGRVMESE